MKPVEPIMTAHLFAGLHEELISLLNGLSDEDWSKPTAAGAWKVSDIVAHLLDSDIRRLSYQRDGWPMVPPDRAIESYQDLVGFLNQLNADWTRASRRISPRLLIEFHSITGPQLAKLFESLDPMGTAFFSVAWAGEEHSSNWFDIAREYTEKWHHQQQIRDAVGAPNLYDRKWLFPVLDSFLRSLPYNYRNVAAVEGTKIVFRINGGAGGDWTLIREDRSWRLYSGAAESPDCIVETDQDAAWRLMTKGLSPDDAAARVAITGQEKLGAVFLRVLAVMA